MTQGLAVERLAPALRRNGTQPARCRVLISTHKRSPRGESGSDPQEFLPQDRGPGDSHFLI